MTRLTEKYSDGTSFIPNYVLVTKGMQSAIDKLAEYEDAEEKGLLLKLPCKVGNIVYKIINQRDSFDDRPYKIVTAVSFNLLMLEEIGKTVFLTQDQAEEALKKNS